ncbi:MAG: sugar phosphate nucleotidyltransferase [Endomicrobiales bacterium]
MVTDLDVRHKISKRSIAMILGGGRGARLFPLTKARAKPAVSVGGKYRLIDIPISNCINSGVSRIYVLTQFLSAGLNRHITRTYRFDAFSDRFVEILAAEQTPTYYDYTQGSADAVRRSFRYLEVIDADYVFILPGDQLCRIDLSDLLFHHLEKGADVTLACVRIPEADVKKSGVVKVDRDLRVTEFAEKPTEPAVVEKYRFPDASGKGKEFLGSMGVYLFNKQALREVLKNIDEPDFGKGIFPKAIKTNRIAAFIFDGYWEDIGTIKSYYEASMMLVEEHPPFSLYDFAMPIYTHHRNLPTPRIFNSRIDSAMIAEGCIIKGSRVRKCIIGIRTYVRSGCDLEESVVIGNDTYPQNFVKLSDAEREKIPFGIKGGTRIRRAIVDKNVAIGKHSLILGSTNESIEVRESEDSPFYIVNGIVVIPRCTVLPDNTVIRADDFARTEVPA